MQSVTAESFDASRAALEFLSSGGDLHQLSRNTTQIDGQVRSAVSQQWRPLLFSAQTLGDIRSRLTNILDSTANLANLVSNMQRDMQEPIMALASRRQQLGSLLSVAATLRSLQRFLQLTSKLRSQLVSPQEIHLGAAALAELFELCDHGQLDRISIVGRELPVLRSLRKTLVDRAVASLEAEFGGSARLKVATAAAGAAPDFQIADAPSLTSSMLILLLLGEFSSFFDGLSKRLNAPPRSPWTHRFSQPLHQAILKLCEDNGNPAVPYQRVSWTARQFSDWSSQQSEDSLLLDIVGTVSIVVKALKDRFVPLANWHGHS
jgi:hypothetical protein